MDNNCAKATRYDLAQGMKEHYRELSGKCCSWSNQIEPAIDCWEREPTLRAELAELKKRLAEAEGWLNQTTILPLLKQRNEAQKECLNLRWLTAKQEARIAEAETELQRLAEAAELLRRIANVPLSKSGYGTIMLTKQDVEKIRIFLTPAHPPRRIPETALHLLSDMGL
jgi:chromosome segregation ATPase